MLPSYPLVLVGDEIGYMYVFAKMYQIYHKIEEVRFIDSDLFGNHYIEIDTEEDGVITYPWLEFLLFEVTDLVNDLYTESTGLHTLQVKAEDVLKNPDFQAMWEHFEDWSSDILAADIGEDDTPTYIEYLYKLFKCTEAYVTENKSMPTIYEDKLDSLERDIDEYYAKNFDEFIIKPTEKEGDKVAIPLPADLEDPFPDNVISPNEDFNLEEEDEGEQIKVNLAKKLFEVHGIYKTI